MLHMWDIPSGMGWWIGFGGIWMVIFWGGLIALIVWSIKNLSGGGGTARENDPLDIAKERYAKGEISEEEFNQLKKDLS